MLNILDSGIEWKTGDPPALLKYFVDSFWMLSNTVDEEREIVVLPDGRIDILFSSDQQEPLVTLLIGLETKPSTTKITPHSKTFAISFNLLAVEYILKTDVSDVLDRVNRLPDGFWGVTIDDLNDFETCCEKVSDKMLSLIEGDIDNRKQKLFQLIYESNGAMSVSDLSKSVFWSSRQINRYFNRRFGLPLKAYCNILRFRSSFAHLKEGKLYPQQNYTDQTHFIKEVRKFSGVMPKELSRNMNSRFIHLTTLSKK